ncbi:hypothetical protein [Frigoriglobus tundricola]|nr:hypothetical protein [Frigoriglobus tundricola]
MDHREPDPAGAVFDLDLFLAGWDEWFPAAEGLRTVDGLLAALSVDRGGAGGESADLVSELAGLREWLTKALACGSRFRIEAAI